MHRRPELGDSGSGPNKCAEVTVAWPSTKKFAGSAPSRNRGCCKSGSPSRAPAASRHFPCAAAGGVRSFGSEVYAVNIFRRLDAKLGKVFREPVTRTPAALVTKIADEVPAGNNLAGCVEATISLSFAILWIGTCLADGSLMRWSVMTLVTKLTARIFRISDELKLISLMRFEISSGLRGMSLRYSEFI